MSTCWFLDFDDTLASGVTTWGLKYALPRLIDEYQLPYDPQQLQQAVLTAQEQSNLVIDPRPLIRDLFETLGWPQHLQAMLMNAVQSGYRPELFPDTIPFLQRLQNRAQPVYIISNNPATPDVVRHLGIVGYIRQIFTPKLCPGTQPKPHRSLWDYIVALDEELGRSTAVFVGDDPWSDGAFAEACGLPCWMVDRDERFVSLRAQTRLQWVGSLLDISIDGSAG